MKWILILNILFVFSAQAADVYDRPKIEPVMSKKYSLRSEVTGELGYLPVGAFSKYWAYGASYTHQYNVIHAWEVLHIFGTQEVQQGLKKELIASYGASDNDFSVLKTVMSSNYIYSPFYTKSLLFNADVVHSQFSLLAGVGYATFSNTTAPLANVGLIQKFFFGDRSSIKFDFRLYNFMTNKDVGRNYISLMLGYSYGMGSEVAK